MKSTAGRPFLMQVYILMALLTGLAGQYSDLFEKAQGIDFYQYWGIGIALKSGRVPDANPYRHEKLIQSTLNEIVDHTTGDPRLKAANKYRRDDLEFAGTPLLFSLWSLVRVESFSTAFFWFSFGKLILFLSGVVLLRRVAGLDTLTALLSGMALLLLFLPATSDFLMGNINLTQFFGISVVAWLCHRLRSGDGSDGWMTAFLILSAASFFVLLKPNIFLVLPLMVLHVLARLDWRLAWRVVIAAAGVVACWLIFPMLQLDSATIWLEWYHKVLAPGGVQGNVAVWRPLSEGNVSIHAYLQSVAGATPGHLAWGLLLFFVTTFLVALSLHFWRARVDVGSSFWVGLRALFADGPLMLIVALVLSTALNPLVWLHYLVVMIVPGLFLIAAEGRGSQLLGLVTLVCASDLIGPFILYLGGLISVSEHMVLFVALHALRKTLLAFVWLPAWVGVLSRVAGRGPVVAD
ncbi:MAG: hypothetical protein HQL66_05795 [Magnetococcales bacterium]|nr:hypothetical protein [Magnetococcales bacterium]